MKIRSGLCVSAAWIGFATAHPALAATPTAFLSSSFPTLRALPPAANVEKLISTFIHNSDAPSFITDPAQTFVTIDTQKVTCPVSAGSCTIAIAANVQASGGVNAGNAWAIAPEVDGSPVNGGPVQGELLPDGNYATGYEYQSVSVPAGKHQLGVQVYSADGATVGYYQIQYFVYKP